MWTDVDRSCYWAIAGQNRRALHTCLRSTCTRAIVLHMSNTIPQGRLGVMSDRRVEGVNGDPANGKKEPQLWV